MFAYSKEKKNYQKTTFSINEKFMYISIAQRRKISAFLRWMRNSNAAYVECSKNELRTKKCLTMYAKKITNFLKFSSVKVITREEGTNMRQ